MLASTLLLSCRGLESLNLSGNTLNSEGFSAVFRLLRSHPSLQLLRLADTDMSTTHLTLLAGIPAIKLIAFFSFCFLCAFELAC